MLLLHLGFLDSCGILLLPGKLYIIRPYANLCRAVGAAEWRISMGGEGRTPEMERRPENKRQRGQIYTGENYGQSTRKSDRRIGSLVESEGMASEDWDFSPRKMSLRESEGIKGYKTADSNQRKAGRRITDSDQERTGRRTTDSGQEKAGRRIADSRRSYELGAADEGEMKPVKKQKSSTGWREKQQERRRRRRKLIFGCFAGVMGIAYIAVAIYFGFHFYEDTVIYGVDCSQKTVDQVKQEVAERLDEYELTIEEREGRTEKILAEEIDLEFVDNSSIDRMLKKQHSYIWPVMMFLKRSSVSSVSFSYDEEKAAQVLRQLDCMDTLRAVAPCDAYIGTTDTGFEVVPEVMGTTLDWEKTRQAVLSALNSGAVTVSLEEADCYVNPEIYSDNEELISDAAAMSELAKAYITYDFGEQKEIVNAPVIKDWIVELADGSFVIDDMKVTEYVENLAVKYDTFGLPLDFYTSIGTTVTLSGGDYGWCIDQDATVVALLNALAEGYQGTMEPEYLYSAMSHENQGLGYTYVEICISQQRMWCYENGNLVVDTPVVTGNPNKDNATPSGGVWAIDAKKRDAILEGEGYEAPVDYWMPFNGDVGIHDFKERYHFGGTIYLTNGSHGCVNTPYEAVQTIFDTVSIGTPVIVYE